MVFMYLNSSKHKHFLLTEKLSKSSKFKSKHRGFVLNSKQTLYFDGKIKLIDYGGFIEKMAIFDK